jgi:hypothetical protein
MLHRSILFRNAKEWFAKNMATVWERSAPAVRSIPQPIAGGTLSFWNKPHSVGHAPDAIHKRGT